MKTSNAIQRANLKSFVDNLTRAGARCDWQVEMNGHTLERWSMAPNALILQVFPNGGFTYYLESGETSMDKCLAEVSAFFNPLAV